MVIPLEVALWLALALETDAPHCEGMLACLPFPFSAAGNLGCDSVEVPEGESGLSSGGGISSGTSGKSHMAASRISSTE